jgi:hypothetical protein
MQNSLSVISQLAAQRYSHTLCLAMKVLGQENNPPAHAAQHTAPRGATGDRCARAPAARHGLLAP